HPTSDLPLRRLAQRRRERGHILLLPRRVERGVLLTAQRLARELDQVVADERDRERHVDLATRQRVARRAPERPPSVRLEADKVENSEREDRTESYMRPGQPAARGRTDAMNIGLLDLIDEACEQPLRIIGARDRASPQPNDLIIGPQEPHIALK